VHKKREENAVSTLAKLAGQLGVHRKSECRKLHHRDNVEPCVTEIPLNIFVYEAVSVEINMAALGRKIAISLAELCFQHR